MKETDLSTKEYCNSRLEEFKQDEKINWLNSTFLLELIHYVLFQVSQIMQ